jgi:poly-beta-1,6-N-acetyl-D-glucosamine synthase
MSGTSTADAPSPTLRFAVVTPVKNEASNLRRLAEALAEQTTPPEQWVVVDTGSSDGTVELARSLAAAHLWIRVAVHSDSAAEARRGGPIVRAFEAGVDLLHPLPDLVVKVDADVSFDREYFASLLTAFDADPDLGIASGGAYELEDGGWRRRHNTGSSVWGAARAYRRDCLADVRPLEQRMGWDGVDELKAHARGWRTATLPELAFYHHRREGGRDRSRTRTWTVRGREARYMGYRPTYLGARALHHAGREPAALLMIWGYLAAAVRRDPRLADPDAVAALRGRQRLRDLAARRRETGGRRAETTS